MSDNQSNQTCVIIGASHGGVNCAFNLRKEGWKGGIVIIDRDPAFPYHRPPMSKAYLTSDESIEKYMLKSADAYEKEEITLMLGVGVEKLDTGLCRLSLSNGESVQYTKLILATGASPILPPIDGISTARHLYTLRTAQDVEAIKKGLDGSKKKVVVIGAGYIGLEIAASIRKLGHEVTILERESRVLARVTSAETSKFFEELHQKEGVQIFTAADVKQIETIDNTNVVRCLDNNLHQADVIIIGVGVKVNLELAAQAGLTIENGIKVDKTCQTNKSDIYAIGDCTYHYNSQYSRYVRLESVQNAVDQSKVVAAVICGKEAAYDAIPWFWSDQFHIKLQIVGLAEGYDELIVRKESDSEDKFSVWYFRDDELLSVDAINNAKAYVIGSKVIKERLMIDKEKLKDSSTELKPATILL